SSADSSRSAATTFIPSCPKRSQIALPIPPAPPVTTAILPTSSIARAPPPPRVETVAQRLLPQPEAAALLLHDPGGAVRLVVELSELGGRRSDLGGQRPQGVEVEVVDLGGVEAEHLSGLVDRDVVVQRAEKLASVWPGSLRVRKVVAPE